MAKQKHEALPESLRYLQPFANQLAKLSPDEINEDVDATRLEAALRKRLRGCDADAASSLLEKDAQELSDWLADKPLHVAHWILGFLLSPDVAVQLTQPAEPTPRGPEMHFDAPKGWSVKQIVPCRLDIKAGKVVGYILAIDDESYQRMLRERDQVSSRQHPQRELKWKIEEINAGETRGKKYTCWMITPAGWKEVSYALQVAGGYVCIKLSTMTGADFDELPFDSKLDTLRLSER